MKTFTITYTHIAGGTHKYSTEHLILFFAKLESVIDDIYVVQQSIVLSTVIDETVIAPVPAGYDHFPKHKLYHDRN